MYTLIFLAALNTYVSIVVPNLDKQTCTETLRDLSNSVRGSGGVRFSRCVQQSDVTIKDQKELDNLIDKVQKE